MSTSRVAAPSLEEVVARARAAAEAAGEILVGTGGPFVSEVPAEARPLIRAWLRDGGYAAAIAQIEADDPELATE